MIIADRSSSTPPTAIPTSRKGSSRIQTRGYNTMTSSASGQQSRSRMHQSRNFNITASLTSQAAKKFHHGGAGGEKKYAAGAVNGECKFGVQALAWRPNY